MPGGVAAVGLVVVYLALMVLAGVAAEEILGDGTLVQRRYEGWELIGLAVLAIGCGHAAKHVRRWWFFVLTGAAAAWLEGELCAGPGLGRLALDGAISDERARWRLGGIIVLTVGVAVMAGEVGAKIWKEIATDEADDQISRRPCG